MQLSPFPCHLVPLRSKYFSQHPILKHPQPAFLPQCQRPGFTPIQNHGAKLYFYISWSLSFWVGTWKTTDSAPNDSKHSLILYVFVALDIAHAPYCHVTCPLYDIFPHYLKSADFPEKNYCTRKCVLIFSIIFVWNISNSKKNWARNDQKCISVFMYRCYSGQILTLKILN